MKIMLDIIIVVIIIYLKQGISLDKDIDMIINILYLFLVRIIFLI